MGAVAVEPQHLTTVNTSILCYNHGQGHQAHGSASSAPTRGRFTLADVAGTGQVDGAGDDLPVSEARDQVATQRDRSAEQRSAVAGQRDQTADQRDKAARQRDHVGERRDQAAEQRDQAAAERDKSATPPATSASSGDDSEALRRSALDRRESAGDRERASQDRRAGASDRSAAEHDRNAALTDRGSGAHERTEAAFDRGAAADDRSASARERESASIDELTGAYRRDAGLVELKREIARARRTQEPLVLAFVDVDRLKAVNDSRGHVAGDRILLEVASTLRARMRSYDLMVRFGGDEFLCALAGLDMADARERLAPVNAALAAAPEHGSVSIGLAELQADDSVDDLVARADIALYLERRTRGTAPEA